MTATWFVPRPEASPSLGVDAVSLLLDSVADGLPGRCMLDFLNRIAPVDYLGVVAFGAGGPSMIEGHARSAGLRNITGDCFARYRACFCGADEVVRRAAQMQLSAGDDAPVLALHLPSADLPDPAWREQIYERERLAARLTLLYAPRPRSAYAIQLYRHESHGPFAAEEIEHITAVAPLLCRAHALALSMTLQAKARRQIDAGTSIDERLVRAAAQLERLAPLLSQRESAVCARIACGISADGIAADLGVAPSTVVTLRKRAYAKLGLSSRLALARMIA
ncbi:MAG: LuxR C-terminal-related transcriptional regulator [Burkholderiaceae bacterium]